MHDLIKTTSYRLSIMAAILDHPLLKRQCVYQLCSVPQAALIYCKYTHASYIALHSLISVFRSISKFEKRHVDAQQPSFVKSMDNILRQLSCFLYILVCVFIQYSLAWNPTSYQFWFSTRNFSPSDFRIPWHHATELRGHGGLSTWWLVSTGFCTIGVCQSVFFRVLFKVTL